MKTVDIFDATFDGLIYEEEERILEDISRLVSSLNNNENRARKGRMLRQPLPSAYGAHHVQVRWHPASASAHIIPDTTSADASRSNLSFSA